MTLPFRRRHHDDETVHDRARALTAQEMLEPLGEDEAAWLAVHLEACSECTQDRAAYLADRELLRSLRERAPEPPRDMWARTSAALDREARGRRGRSAGATSQRRGLPFGAAAGAMLVLVVIGASILPSLIPPFGPSSETPGRSSVAVLTPGSQPTNFKVAAGRVGWIRPGLDGAWELVISDVDEICPRSRADCQPLGEGNLGRRVDLGGMPTGVTISPTENQLVVEARSAGTAPDRIFVIQVPPEVTAPSPEPSVATPTDGAPSGEPVTPAPGSPAPSPLNPDGAIEIASGVIVVGEIAFSDDGHWLAFSARPSDGSTGPDLYLWSVGAPSAVAVTTDHRTYFSTWLHGRVLASRVDVAPSPETTAGPSSAPTADASEAPAQPAVEAHPASFLLDPATLAQTEIPQRDIWLPVVDPNGRFVAFWSGTLLPTADGLDWQLGTGNLVLDGWSDGPAPAPSSDPAAEQTADPAAASSDPAPSATPGLGPTGTPAVIVTDPMATFEVKFDPSGSRLAVWVAEQLDAAVGRLHLIVLDPTTGIIDQAVRPLPGTPALRRFSIDVGRLAWVSPSGQDGQESAVEVLGWSNDEFGETRTIPARDLYIVR